MKTLTLLFAALNSLALLAGTLAPVEVVKIESFGKNGDLTPTFMGSPINPVFFNQPQYEHLKTDRFRTSHDLRSIKAQAAKRPDTQLQLTLVNLTGTRNDVIVSATRFKDNSIQNFLVRVNADSEIFLDVSGLRDFDFVALDSNKEFQAFLGRGDKAAWDETALKITEPEVIEEESATASKTGWCYEISRTLTVEPFGEPENAIDAIFDRVELGLSNCPELEDQFMRYEMDVYYPNSSTLHASGSGSTTYCYTPCRTMRYATVGVSNSNLLHWSNVVPVSDYFDDVIFSYDYGTAKCSTINPLGTDCTGSNAADFNFYVYRPALGSPQ